MAIVYAYVDWNHLAEGKDQRRAVVNVVVNLPVS
jgi:hypothetical protein